MTHALLGCTECGARLAHRDDEGVVVIYTGCWDEGAFLKGFSVEYTAESTAEETGRSRLRVRCPRCGATVELTAARYGFQGGTPE